MKELHEFATVLNGNKRVGFLLQRGTVKDVAPLMYVPEDQFTEMVRMNFVQYFTYKDGGYKVEYTNEERSQLRKIGSACYDTREYFQKDIRVQSRYLIRALEGHEIYFMPFQVMKIRGIMCVMFYMIHSQADMLFNQAVYNTGLNEHIRSILNTLNFKWGRYKTGGNMSVAYCTVDTFKDFCEYFGRYYCDCSMIKSVSTQLKESKGIVNKLMYTLVASQSLPEDELNKFISEWQKLD